jgi:hypothetical protein
VGFPEKGRAVSAFLQTIAQRFLSHGYLTWIVRVPGPIREASPVDMIAGYNRVSGGSADCGRRMRMMKGNASLRQSIDVRRNALASLGIQDVDIAVSDIVGHEDQDIGAVDAGSRCAGKY